MSFRVYWLATLARSCIDWLVVSFLQRASHWLFITTGLLQLSGEDFIGCEETDKARQIGLLLVGQARADIARRTKQVVGNVGSIVNARRVDRLCGILSIKPSDRGLAEGAGVVDAKPPVNAREAELVYTAVNGTRPLNELCTNRTTHPFACIKCWPRLGLYNEGDFDILVVSVGHEGWIEIFN